LNKLKILKYTFGTAILILIDLAVYIILGIGMMRYDDFYEESMGEYWSWETLSQFDKQIVVGLYAWNIINILIGCYLIYRLVRWIKKSL